MVYVQAAYQRLGFTKVLATTHDDMVTSCLPQHIGYQLGRDRSSALVLLVLSCVHEVRNDSGDSSSRGNLAGMDHDAKLHQGGVDFAGTLQHCSVAVSTVRLTALLLSL